MKKVMSILICVVLLASCSGENMVDTLSLDKCTFESNVELIWQDKQFNGEIQRADINSIRLKISGDDLAVPVCYKISQGGYRVAQGELEYSVSLGDTQPQSAAMEIYRVFELWGRYEPRKSDNLLVYETPYSILKYDRKANAITSIETKNGKIIFKDFKFLSKEQ